MLAFPSNGGNQLAAAPQPFMTGEVLTCRWASLQAIDCQWYWGASAAYSAAAVSAKLISMLDQGEGHLLLHDEKSDY